MILGILSLTSFTDHLRTTPGDITIKNCPVSNIKPNIKARFVVNRAQIFSNKSDAIAIAVTKPAATKAHATASGLGTTSRNPNNITYFH
jgi:hypothetical protein